MDSLTKLTMFPNFLVMLRAIVIISILVNIVTAIVLVACIEKYGVKALIAKILSKKVETPLPQSPHYTGRVDLLQSLPQSDSQIVMLGDSITEGGEWQEFFPGSRIVNRGIGNDTAQGVFNRVKAYAEHKPEKIFLLIGINDLLNGADVSEVANTIAETIKLISTLSPSTKIFVQSVLPCRKDLVAKEKILQLNERLKSDAQREHSTFIDVYSSFIDKNGEQVSVLFIPDGVHLSASGYMVWLQILKPLVLMKSN